MPQKSSTVSRHFALVPRVCAAIAASVLLIPAAAPAQPPTPVLLDAMTTELHRAFTSLGKQGPANRIRQAVAALLPQLLGERRDRRVDPGAIWRAGRQLPKPCPRGRRAGAAGQPEAGQHARRPSRLGGEQPATAAGRRSRGAGAVLVAGDQHRLRHGAGQLSAREDRGRGAGQGRGHLAGLQPGGAAVVHRQAGAAGGGGPGGVGAAGAGAVAGFPRIPGCVSERGDADGRRTRPITLPRRKVRGW